MTITIYHNPRCSKSRNTLGLIRESGTEPEIVEYLKGALTRERLEALLAKMDTPLRDLLRSNETPYKDHDLGDPKWSDSDLIDHVVEHPILLNRPIVETRDRAKLCRPEDIVHSLLDAAND